MASKISLLILPLVSMVRAESSEPDYSPFYYYYNKPEILKQHNAFRLGDFFSSGGPFPDRPQSSE